jgi:tripartite-type tricarboxylate transporter receptor subunit TctC
MRRLVAAAALAISWASIGSTQAEDYPARPITIVVPYAAGGPFDATIRILSEHMRTSLGQAIVIENVSGAGGSIGTGRVAQAAPDGYTVITGGLNTHVVNPAVLQLQYDVIKDFEPIGLLAGIELLIVAKKSITAHDLKELIAWLKANPDKASLGTAGKGTTPHLAALLFQRETGTRFALVSYRGAAPAMNDLVAGHIDLMIDPMNNSLPQVRAGTIKAYAVMSPKRVAVAADIPTVDEAGLSDLHMQAWQALWAPKGTPPSVITRLNSAIIAALDDPGVRSRLADLGLQLFAREQMTPDRLAAFHKSEIEKWWPIIKGANIKLD